MTTQEALAAMRDIHVPDNVINSSSWLSGMSPLWLLVMLPPVLWWLAARRRAAWRRQVTRSLDVIADTARAGDPQRGWQELSNLLRRLALLVEPSVDSAATTGVQWLATLDRLLGTDCFASGSGRALASHPYRPPASGEASDLLATIAQVKAVLPRLTSHR